MKLIFFFDIFPHPAVAFPLVSLPSNQISKTLSLLYSSLTDIIKFFLVHIKISSVQAYTGCCMTFIQLMYSTGQDTLPHV